MNMCIWYGLMERQAHDRFFGTKLGVVTQPFFFLFFPSGWGRNFSCKPCQNKDHYKGKPRTNDKIWRQIQIPFLQVNELAS